MADIPSGAAGFDPARLELELVALGRSLDLPPTPDLRAAVLARLPDPGPDTSANRRPRDSRTRDRWLPQRRAVRLVAASIAAAVIVGLATPAGQAAVARVVHAFGVVLRLGTPSAPARPEQLPSPTAGPLEAARRQVAFPVVVPAALGTPDQVVVSDGGRVLSLVYLAGLGRPTPGPGGVSARLDEFDGALDPVFLKTSSVGAEWIDLPGGPALWFDGPHDVVYLDRQGATRTETAHLAARTLVWTVGSVTLRLEGDLTREAAVAIAHATVTPTPAP